MKFFKIAAIFGLIQCAGCVKIPLEISLSDELAFTHSEIDKISEKLYEILSQLNFSHPPDSPAGLIDPTICSKAYQVWLQKSFDEGRILRGVIQPAVYAASSNDPKISECRPINFDDEYKKALELSARNEEREVEIFSLDPMRDELGDNPCLDIFLNPEKEKVAVKSISIAIVENSLTFDLPTTKVYSSHKQITKEMLVDEAQREELIRTDKLMLLAESEAIASRFTGNYLTRLVNAEDKFYAEAPLIALKGSVVVIPDVFSSKPRVVEEKGNQYYLVPKGQLKMKMRIGLTIWGRLKDVKCLWDHFKDGIKKEDQERRIEKEEKERIEKEERERQAEEN